MRDDQTYRNTGAQAQTVTARRSWNVPGCDISATVPQWPFIRRSRQPKKQIFRIGSTAFTSRQLPISSSPTITQGVPSRGCSPCTERSGSLLTHTLLSRPAPANLVDEFSVLGDERNVCLAFHGVGQPCPAGVSARRKFDILAALGRRRRFRGGEGCLQYVNVQAAPYAHGAGRELIRTIRDLFRENRETRWSTAPDS